MLLAIDVGNTQTVYGLWDGQSWCHTWRRETDPQQTEDQFAGWLWTMFQVSGVPFRCDRVIAASVVPQLDFALDRFVAKYFKLKLISLRSGDQVGLRV
jgi:type III pantothenate kinase